MFAKIAAVCCLFGLAMGYTVRPNQLHVFPTRTSIQDNPKTFHQIDSNNRVATLKCPINFHFDSKLMKCTPTHLSYECYEKYCQNNHMGLVPYPKNCSKYVNCGFWNAELQECPKGLLFNKSMNSCDYLERVDCCEYEAKDEGLIVEL